MPPGVPITGSRLSTGLRNAARVAGTVAILVVALAAGLGWLYVLRSANLFAAGPNVNDSLPLLQLAGFDGQPLLRMVVAFLPVGIAAGLALGRLGRIPRGVTRRRARRGAAAVRLASVLRAGAQPEAQRRSCSRAGRVWGHGWQARCSRSAVCFRAG